MRLIFRAAVCAVLVVGLLAVSVNAQDMLPEQNAARAKQVLDQAITALGGQAYLSARDTDCDGRIAQFGTNDQLMGFTLFRDMWLLPDKNRTEYISKGEHTILGYLLGIQELDVTHGGVLITIFNKNEGWLLDKSGVSNQSEDMVNNFTDQLKTGMNTMLRARRNDPGVEAHYAGTDLIDLKEAEWVEFMDADHRTFRLAVDRLTHLPLRWVVVTRDPETRERTEVITSYSQYIAMDGVKTPLSIVRARDDRKLTQTFLTACKYNTNIDPQLFTRASLEQHSAEVSKKGYKKPKEKN